MKKPASIFLLVVAFAVSACSEGSDCAVGTEACECTDGGGCDPGLTCLSDVCVAADGTAGSGSGTGAGTGGGGTGSTAVDVCVEKGGERRSDGVCLLRCPSEPGGSINDPNCPDGWWCNGVGYCTRYKECDNNGDCDEPGHTTSGYECFAGTCYVACGEALDCPTGSTCDPDGYCVRF